MRPELLGGMSSATVFPAGRVSQAALSFPRQSFSPCAGDYQAGAWGSYNAAAAAASAADGFHSNQPATTCCHGSAPVCCSEGWSHDFGGSPETDRRSRRGDEWEGRSKLVKHKLEPRQYN